MAVDVASPDVHMIDYTYSTQGVFYHGTISDLDGTPKSTWTVSEQDHKTKFDQPIDQDTFAFLWNGIANYRVFKASIVQGNDAKLNFYKFQIIGIAFRSDGQMKGRNYQILPTETDPDYKQWIKKLNVPWVKAKSETIFEKLGKALKLIS